MSLSIPVMMSPVLLLLLGAVAIGHATFQTIGPCTVKVATDATIDFDKVANENGGTWYYVMIPDTDTYKNTEKMWATFKKTATKGQYQMAVSLQNSGAPASKHPMITVKDKGSGHAELQGTLEGKPITVELSVVKYLGGCLYYHVCGNGGAATTDSRYVLAHADLTNEQKNIINTLDKGCGFKGKLKTLKK